MLAVEPRPNEPAKVGAIDTMTMQTQAPARRLLSAREAGAYLGCAASSIYAAVEVGALRPLRTSSRMRFDLADLESLIEVAKVTGRPIFGAPINKSRRER
jgi:predicted DNA-binding transcriptional regulator AlpA